MTKIFFKKIQQINAFSAELKQKAFDELLDFRDKHLRQNYRLIEISSNSLKLKLLNISKDPKKYLLKISFLKIA